MKNINIILIIISLLTSCEQTSIKDTPSTQLNDNVDISSIENNSQQAESKKVLNRVERRTQVAAEKRIQKSHLDYALKDAFRTAKKEFNTNSFTTQYSIQPDSSSFAIDIEIEIGKLFNDEHTYFLLRRNVPWAAYLNIYKVNGGHTEELISRQQEGMTSIRDTIYDVNGDKRNDFLVHWYPSSGCCRRNVYNVYLNQPDGTFTTDYEFINPTFSSSEQIIRGVGYGHPGEVGLYKYKWDGLEVDTLEYIYPDVSKEGQFIKTVSKEYRPDKTKGTILKEVPREYLEIESFEWFSEY
ncbi:hypothetical protein [Flammeovirga sp. SJP92]|uniref:hypothetical protein n=1 Tax=Flammeovirga sp. SJP92 TaxID=1775430 RepID=UPI00078803BB|nr:hypothetical protein [Flammeovirga sp. SJP92]KXX66794.1 hypothetical protein AVL50_30135 [Flammeovirga sp. SJP92]